MRLEKKFQQNMLYFFNIRHFEVKDEYFFLHFFLKNHRFFFGISKLVAFGSEFLNLFSSTRQHTTFKHIYVSVSC